MYLFGTSYRLKSFKSAIRLLWIPRILWFRQI